MTEATSAAKAHPRASGATTLQGSPGAGTAPAEWTPGTSRAATPAIFATTPSAMVVLPRAGRRPGPHRGSVRRGGPPSQGAWSLWPHTQASASCTPRL